MIIIIHYYFIMVVVGRMDLDYIILLIIRDVFCPC